MDETEIKDIKQKSASGVIFLSIRNIGIQAVSVLGFFILTIILGAGEVGLFAIVAESVAILGYFSDIGLASALIQQKEEVTTEELRSTFFVQQLLVMFGLLVIAIIYPGIASSKGYGTKELMILLSLCFSFVAASLKTIPSVLLERKLNFKTLSTVDIIENLSFYIIAVTFAVLGFGVFSYAIATFIRSFLGLILIYKLSPWSIGISFSYPAVKKLFKYGIPFQLNSFIAVAKDRLSTLLVAGILGRESFGLLSWAQKGPRVPLSFMDAIMKVTFPTFSRLQDNLEILGRSIQKSVYYIALFVFPSLAGISLIAHDVIDLIPKYTKWQPALIPLYFFAVSYAIAAVTTPLTNAFNAVGKIKITTKLMLMWTALTWVFYPLLSWKFGYIGTSAAAAIVGSSSVIVWWLAKKHFDVNILRVICHPAVSTIIMIFSVLPVNSLGLSPLFSIFAKALVGALVFVIYHSIFSKKDISWIINEIKCLIVRK